MLWFDSSLYSPAAQCIAREMDRAFQMAFPGNPDEDMAEQARKILRNLLDHEECDIWFLPGVSQGVWDIMGYCVKPFEATIRIRCSHRFDSAAWLAPAYDRNIISMTSRDDKVTRSILESAGMGKGITSSHHSALPRLLWLSNPNSFGLCYTRKELEEISSFCRENGILVFMNGENLPLVLAAQDEYGLADLQKWCDGLSLGISSCGGLFGEALVVFHPEMRRDLWFALRQDHGRLPKRWLIPLQFKALFQDDTWKELAGQAVRQARKVQDAIVKMKYPLYIRSHTNSVFFIVSNDEFERISRNVHVDIWEEARFHKVITLRFAWNCTDRETDELIEILQEARNPEQESFLTIQK